MCSMTFFIESIFTKAVTNFFEKDEAKKVCCFMELCVKAYVCKFMCKVMLLQHNNYCKYCIWSTSNLPHKVMYNKVMN